ncbi:hypothetical protein VaNZ11_006672 [Volvox africanus]|uniref:Uncharacterized protein n=1 Tax=Volvox africanus TaxID=51714 RepID=A0ABQ5S2H1_9CHLO|nr:hypothetical protein VaNZ11_006672 [Volvox africanus]
MRSWQRPATHLAVAGPNDDGPILLPRTWSRYQRSGDRYPCTNISSIIDCRAGRRRRSKLILNSHQPPRTVHGGHHAVHAHVEVLIAPISPEADVLRDVRVAGSGTAIQQVGSTESGLANADARSILRPQEFIRGLSQFPDRMGRSSTGSGEIHRRNGTGEGGGEEEEEGPYGGQHSMQRRLGRRGRGGHGAGAVPGQQQHQQQQQQQQIPPVHNGLQDQHQQPERRHKQHLHRQHHLQGRRKKPPLPQPQQQQQQQQQHVHVTLVHARHCLSRALASAGSPRELEALLGAGLASSPGLPLLDPVCISAAVCRMVRLRRSTYRASGLAATGDAADSASGTGAEDCYRRGGSNRGYFQGGAWRRVAGRAEDRGQARKRDHQYQAEQQLWRGVGEGEDRRGEGGGAEAAAAVVVATAEDASGSKAPGSRMGLLAAGWWPNGAAPARAWSTGRSHQPAAFCKAVANERGEGELARLELDEGIEASFRTSGHQSGGVVMMDAEKVALQSVSPRLASGGSSRTGGITFATEQALAMVSPSVAAPGPGPSCSFGSAATAATVAAGALQTSDIAVPTAAAVAAAAPGSGRIAGSSATCGGSASWAYRQQVSTSSTAHSSFSSASGLATTEGGTGHTMLTPQGLAGSSLSPSPAHGKAMLRLTPAESGSAAAEAARAAVNAQTGGCGVPSEDVQQTRYFLRLVSTAVRQCLGDGGTAPAGNLQSMGLGFPSPMHIPNQTPSPWMDRATQLKEWASPGGAGGGGRLGRMTSVFLEAAAAAEAAATAAAATNPGVSTAVVAPVGRFRPRELSNVVWGLACLRRSDSQLCGQREDQRLLLRLVEELLPELPQPPIDTVPPSTVKGSESYMAAPAATRTKATVVRSGSSAALAESNHGEAHGGAKAASIAGAGAHGRNLSDAASLGISSCSRSSTDDGNADIGTSRSCYSRGSTSSSSSSSSWFCSRWRPGELAMLGWGMARAGVAPPSHRWLLSFITAWDNQTLAAAGASDLACLAWSLARWHRMAVRLTAWRHAITTSGGGHRGRGYTWQRRITRRWLRPSVSRIYVAALRPAAAPLHSLRSLLPPAWLEAFWSISGEQLRRSAVSTSAAYPGMRSCHPGLPHSTHVDALGGHLQPPLHSQLPGELDLGAACGSENSGQGSAWGASEVAMLLWSVGVLRLEPPAQWLEAALRTAAAAAQGAQPLALATTLRGAALISTCAPVQRPSAIEAISGPFTLPRPLPRSLGAFSPAPSAAAAGEGAAAVATATAAPARAAPALGSTFVAAASVMPGALVTGRPKAGLLFPKRANAGGVEKASDTTSAPNLHAAARRAGLQIPLCAAGGVAAEPLVAAEKLAQPLSPPCTLRRRPVRPPPAPCQSLVAAFARAYLGHCAAAIGSFGPSQVVDFLAALEVLSASGHLPAPESLPLPIGGLIDAATARLQRCYSLGLGVRHLVAAANSLAEMGHTPPADWLDWWLEEMYGSFVSGRLRGHELADVLRALAVFRVVPGPTWRAALLSAAARQLRHTDRLGLTRLVESMAAAGLRLGGPCGPDRASGRADYHINQDGSDSVRGRQPDRSSQTEAASATAAANTTASAILPAETEPGAGAEGDSAASWSWLSRFLRVWAGLRGVQRVRYYGLASPLLRPPTTRQADRLCKALAGLAGPISAWPPGPRLALRSVLLRIPELRGSGATVQMLRHRARGRPAAATGASASAATAAATTCAHRGSPKRCVGQTGRVGDGSERGQVRGTVHHGSRDDSGKGRAGEGTARRGPNSSHQPDDVALGAELALKTRGSSCSRTFGDLDALKAAACELGLR